MSEEYTGSPEMKPIWDLGNLAMASVEQVPLDTEGATSLGFVAMVKHPDATVTAEQLVEAIKAAPKGYYQDEPVERLKSGPSYIELGAWIGSQSAALCLMGLGKILGLWDIITPMTLGVDGEQANQMMGSGFVMIAPGADSPLLVE